MDSDIDIDIYIHTYMYIYIYYWLYTYLCRVLPGSWLKEFSSGLYGLSGLNSLRSPPPQDFPAAAHYASIPCKGRASSW